MKRYDVRYNKTYKGKLGLYVLRRHRKREALATEGTTEQLEVLL